MSITSSRSISTQSPHRRRSGFAWLIAVSLALVIGLGQTTAQATGGTTEATTKAAASEKAPAVTVYTCPMHPEVISEKPGRCPKCGMKLVPKTPEPNKKP